MMVDRSLLSGALEAANKVGGLDTAAALSQVADAIEMSGNKDAADSFNAFNEELQQPMPRKSLLSSCWNALVEELPTIADLAGAPTAIVALFA
jgi:hypothetical protein